MRVPFRKRSVRALAFSTLQLVAVARAEPPATESEQAQAARSPRVTAELELRLGATTAPSFTRAFPEVRGHGLVGLARGSYRVRAHHGVGIEMPLLAVSVEQPAGSYLDEFTWGNLALSYLHERPLRAANGVHWTLVSGALVGLPIAERSESQALSASRALRIGSALDGFRHPELYTEGVLPVAGWFGVELERRWLFAHASLRVPLLFRLSDAGLPEDARTRAVGVTPILRAHVAGDATRWFRVSLAADGAFELVRTVELERDAPRAQLTLTPGITFRLPRGVELESTFVLPVASALGGTTYAGSFSIAYRH